MARMARVARVAKVAMVTRVAVVTRVTSIARVARVVRVANLRCYNNFNVQLSIVFYQVLNIKKGSGEAGVMVCRQG